MGGVSEAGRLTSPQPLVTGGRTTCQTSRAGWSTTVMVPTSAVGIAFLKKRSLREKDAPGSWLTHSVERTARSELPPEEAAEDMAEVGEV